MQIFSKEGGGQAEGVPLQGVGQAHEPDQQCCHLKRDAEHAPLLGRRLLTRQERAAEGLKADETNLILP